MSLQFLKFVSSQFGRASMLSKFSLIFNAILCYAVIILNQREEKLRNEIIRVHLMRYEDTQILLEKMNIIKSSIRTNSITIKDIDSAVSEIKGQKQ
jgi:hypothetical protein